MVDIKMCIIIRKRKHRWANKEITVIKIKTSFLAYNNIVMSGDKKPILHKASRLR